ncbi:MAG: class I SAM-dependent methyltransferase [Nanoarchaeota archaeon]
MFKENYHSEGFPVFVDLGSNDGRVVAVASALGYKSYGIELDKDAYKSASDNFTALRHQVSSLEHATLYHGNYSDKSLIDKIPFRDAFVFYNYDDSNVGEIAALIARQGKPGAFLILQAYADYSVRIPLRLVGVLDHQNRKYNPPIFDVFQKPVPYSRKR